MNDPTTHEQLIEVARREGRVISLKPESDSRAFDQTAREVLVMAKDSDAWYARPLANLECPTLTYPRYAWTQVDR